VKRRANAATYGGFLLLGGRLGDILGRRRMLVAGVIIFALSSLAGGLASSQGVLVGARLVVVGGALTGGAGIYYLSRVPVHGSYVADLLPGFIVMSLGMGSVFVAVTTAANAGVPGEAAGLAAGLLNASQQVGSALGLAILSAIAITRTNDLLAAYFDVYGPMTNPRVIPKPITSVAAFLTKTLGLPINIIRPHTIP